MLREESVDLPQGSDKAGIQAIAVEWLDRGLSLGIRVVCLRCLLPSWHLRSAAYLRGESLRRSRPAVLARAVALRGHDM